MALTVNGTTIPQTLGQLTVNGVQLTKVTVTKDGTTTTVWEVGGTVTYYVDSSVVKSELKSNGASCFPTSFTPSKSGWTFVGWREDSSASTSVLSSKTMGTSNISLYAVWKRTLTLSYAGGGATGGSTASQTGDQIWNAANNYSNPSFALRSNGFTRSGYTFTGWSLGAAGATVTISSDTTATAQWTQATSTCTYVANGSRTATTQNIGANLLSRTASRSGYTFVGWSNSASSTSTLSSCTMGASPVTLYAVWRHTHSDSCYSGETKDCFVYTGADPMETCSNCGGTAQNYHWKCSYCNREATTRHNYCTCGQLSGPDTGGTSCNHYITTLTCGISEGLSVY